MCIYTKHIKINLDPNKERRWDTHNNNSNDNAEKDLLTFYPGLPTLIPRTEPPPQPIWKAEKPIHKHSLARSIQQSHRWVHSLSK